jgi:hypothetical protein
MKLLPTRPGLIAMVVITIVVTYFIPSLLTIRLTGLSDIPPLFAPDGYTYLAMTKALSPGSAYHVNPWYGSEIANSIGYRTFPLPFFLYSALHQLSGNWTVITFFWNLIGILALAATAFVVIKKIVGDDEVIVAGAVLFFFLFSADALPVEISAWIRALQGSAVDAMSLPFIRIFYPQVPAVLVLLSFCFLASPRLRESWTPWLWLCATQFVSLICFPFATIFIALTCLFTLLLSQQGSVALPSRRVLLFAVLCSATDAAYLFLMKYGAEQAGTGRAILHFDPSNFGTSLGGTTLLLAGLSLTAYLYNPRGHVNIIIASAGLSNIVELFMDVFFNPELKISHHAGYFVHTSLALLLILLSVELCRKVFRRPAELRIVFCLVGAISLVNGLVAAHSLFRTNFRINAVNSRFAALLPKLGVGNNTLLVLPAGDVDSPSALAPLVTATPILYTRNAELLLNASDKLGIQSERQATYLYLTGETSESLSRQLSDESGKRLTNLDEQSYWNSRSRRQKTLIGVRMRLLPKIAFVQNGGKYNWLRAYKTLARIIHEVEAAKSLLCYKHVVKTVFASQQEASA